MIDASIFVHASEPFLSRFLANLTEGENDCWVWGSADGLHNAMKVCGRVVGTHRVAYEWAKGAAFCWQDIDHLCFNPPCCNPNHLRAVTRAVNVQAGKSRIGDPERLSNPLYAYMIQRGITREAMADLLGATIKVVDRLARRRHYPCDTLRRQLAELLAMSEDEVVPYFALNIKRRKSGAPMCAKGHSLLDPKNVYICPAGRHRCRACRLGAPSRQRQVHVDSNPRAA